MDMEKAYEETIRDFDIDLAHTEWWRFKRIWWLNDQIDYYTKLLNDL